MTDEELIQRWAQDLRDGQLPRTSGFRSATGKDITDAVLTAAGPETDAEREARAAYREKRMGNLLAGEIGREAEEHFFAGGFPDTLRVDGEDFTLCYDDDIDQNDLVFVRESTGQRFLIDISVYAEELPARQLPPPSSAEVDEVERIAAAEEAGPGPGQQALI